MDKDIDKLPFYKNILYLLLKGSGYVIAALPQFIRFGIADVIFFILFYIVRYRRTVTRTNLTRSFPEKSIKEIQKIEKDYYRHLGDIFVDSVSVIGMSKEKIASHCTYEDDNFREFNATRPVICALSHYGSWEYCHAYSLRTSHKLMPVYRPIANKVVDKFYLTARSKFGAEPCMMSAVVKRIIKRKHENIIMAMLADQSPLANPNHPWYTFLNQDTQFFVGIGEMAIRYGMGVFFLDVTRVKRGYYHGKMIQIYDPNEDVDYATIIERYKDNLENMIHRNPALWCWSHRRWKHKKNN
ncbi:MAG: lysophospholipid acyltransferase family protein [Rikenellaceae bacterium]